MSDPRNAAHDKRVAQEKKHHIASSAPPSPKAGKKQKPASDANAAPAPATTASEAPPATGPSPELEGSLVVLAQLKDLAFHANAHQGRLAEMMLTVEEKLKQKDFANAVGDLYSAQAALHDKLTEFIAKYAAECERMQGQGG